MKYELHFYEIENVFKKWNEKNKKKQKKKQNFILKTDFEMK